MLKLTAIIKTEGAYFANKISENARRVVYSDIAHTLSSPLTDIFLGAFIWRSTGSLISVLLYKVSAWSLLPLVFYANGRLLRRLPVQKAFACGAILAGLSPLALIFLAPSGNGAILSCGCLYGIGCGFYWANRNYLEFKETVAEARKYFFSLISVASGISGIIVPLLAGWFIFFGESSGLYAPAYAYWILFIVAFFLLLACAAFIWKGAFASLPLESLRLKTPVLWTRRRLLFFSHGFIDGVGFISSLLLLYVLGNEGGLGIASSITAACLIIATYVYGRIVPDHVERPTVLFSALLFLAAAISLVLLPSIAAVFIYVIAMSIAYRFSVLSSTSIGLTLADEETKATPNTPYAFIPDNELLLNLGRVAGGVIIAALSLYYSQTTGLFYGPLCLAIIHIICIAIFFRKK